MRESPQGLISVKLFEQYFIRKIAGPFLVIALSITGIAWLSQSLKFIDLIVNKGLSLGSFFYLSLLILPSLLWVIIPAATFIAIVYGYHKLYGDSELVIFRAIGIDNHSLMRPALIFCVLTTLMSYSISLYLLPASYREFKDMQIYIRNNYASVLLQEGVFVNPTQGLTVYIREKDPLGVMKGLMVHDNRNKSKSYTITAQEATLENTPKGPMFVLRNGSHQEFNKKTGQFSLLYFDSYNLELELFNNELIQKRWREAPELYLNELFFGDNPKKSERLKQISEGHYRLTWPLYNFLLCMVALIPFIRGEFSRRGNVKRISRVSVAAIGIMIGGLAVKSITAQNVYLNVLDYFFILVGMIIAYRLLVNGSKVKPAKI